MTGRSCKFLLFGVLLYPAFFPKQLLTIKIGDVDFFFFFLATVTVFFLHFKAYALPPNYFYLQSALSCCTCDTFSS